MLQARQGQVPDPRTRSRTRGTSTRNNRNQPPTSQPAPNNEQPTIRTTKPSRPRTANKKSMTRRPQQEQSPKKWQQRQQHRPQAQTKPKPRHATPPLIQQKITNPQPNKTRKRNKKTIPTTQTNIPKQLQRTQPHNNLYTACLQFVPTSLFTPPSRPHTPNFDRHAQIHTYMHTYIPTCIQI